MAHNIRPLRQGLDEVTLIQATVQGGGPDRYLVQTPFGVVGAQCALSCLVKPEAQDTVLLSSSGQSHFILAVLTRQGEGMAIQLRGDTRIEGSGSINLHSAEEIQLTGAKKVGLTSAEVAVTGIQTRLLGQRLDVVMKQVEADHEDVNVRAARMTTWVGRLTQRADTVMRIVEGVETARIGQLVKIIRESYTLNALHAVVTARKDVKIDGERIHMG